MVTTLLLVAGLIAGFIDSIAGGGGLVTLPVFFMVLGHGPVAIGTNKINGSVAALVALLVYLKAGQIRWRPTLFFGLWVTLGSLFGSEFSPLVPKEFFRWILLGVCPVILWVIWKKEFWISRSQVSPSVPWISILVGFCVGFYDGFVGPGGGTLMFLGLIFFVKLPLFPAIAATKFVNFSSAFVSLLNYQRGEYVQWAPGFVMASGTAIGAFLGARVANQKAAAIVRPALFVVVILLVAKVVFGP